MKKFILPAFVMSLLLVPSVFAEDEGMSCIQVLQSAVGPDGSCEYFPTPCDVPDDWKLVPSCEEVRDVSFGLTPDEVANRRKELRRKKYEEMQQEPDDKETLLERSQARYRKFGSGSYTRSTKNDSLKTDKGTKISDRKFVTPQFGNSWSYDRYRRLNIKMKYNQKREDASGEENAALERPGIISTISDVFREGKLSNTPKWSVQQQGRIRNIPTGKNPYRLKTKIQRKPKNRVYEGPSLQKVYKGDRMEGDLDN